MPANVLGTGLAFPVAVDSSGRVAVASGTEDVEQAIGIILATAPGERPMRPDFGCDVHRLVFEQLDGATVGRMERAIRVALRRWEPRIDVEGITFNFDREHGGGRLLVDIAYRLRATNSRRNLIYPFYLIADEGPG
jgi:phage baseplate assembly protein W